MSGRQIMNCAGGSDLGFGPAGADPVPGGCQVQVLGPAQISSRMDAWRQAGEDWPTTTLSHDPRWLYVLREGIGHRPYGVEAVAGGQLLGVLPLCFVRSALFGRFLVSLPYLNTAGVQAGSAAAVDPLLDAATGLADQLDANYLELRHEAPLVHSSLTRSATAKKHLRLPLPASVDALWKGLDPKVRNQVRKGGKQEFQVAWGGGELLRDFYAVFSRNMRDLGTPVYGKSLFAAILRHFPQEAELCVLRSGKRAVAAAVLIHGQGVTEVPSASSIRSWNSSNANMYMYWQLLQRAVERGQHTFDFGRSSEGSGTFRFKTQWGARPCPAVWQYYLRRGDVGDMRPENRKYQQAIRLWQRLPLGIANMLGPRIVRGIP